MPSFVASPRAADSQLALQHFQSLLKFETDCWDVHYAVFNNLQDFVLLDVRSEEMHQRGHLPQAVSMPHASINQQTLAEYPEDTFFVVYCAGPHCNATERAAIRLARLNRPVKKMLGGITGWLDEGFELVTD